MKTLLFLLALVLPTTLMALPPMPAEHQSLILPPALKPGDTIAFVAPARQRPLFELEIVAEELEKLGYKVTFKYNLEESYRNFSAPDEDRTRTFNAAFADPEVDAVFPVTGGYGVTRILDDIDFGAIRANPKVVIGYSDITGLHLALYKKAGLVSFHSPFPSYMYRPRKNPVDYTFARGSFWGSVTGSDPMPVLSADGLTSPVITIEGGIGRGRLTGGNLSLVAALMGTPYEMETDGHILFLEDVGEAPYRIDRMLSTLELAGKLDNLSGVVLGRWAGCDPDDPTKEFTLEELFEHYFGGRGYPVVYQFPMGHVVDNATFPVGAYAELDADAGTVRLLERVVSTE